MTVSRGPYVRGVNWATYEFWTSASSRRLPPKALPPFETAKSCPRLLHWPKSVLDTATGTSGVPWKSGLARTLALPGSGFDIAGPRGVELLTTRTSNVFLRFRQSVWRGIPRSPSSTPSA